MPSPDDRTHPARPPLCASAPVLWSLMPLVSGIVSVKFTLPLFSAVLAAVAAAAWFSRKTVWKIVILTSFATGFAVQYSATVKPHPDWESLPQREAGFLLRISELFNARDVERISGIAEIIQTDIPHDTISGTGTSFYLETDNAGGDYPSPGQLIACSGVITYLPYLDDHDGFQEYLLGRGIFTTINRGAVSGTIGEAPRLEKIRGQMFRLCQKTLRGNSTGQESPGNVLASMLLGNRSLLSDERIDLYRQTGTYHLFAVSGLHVGSVALFIAAVCRFAGIAGKWIPFPVLAASWYYVWLTGSSPSAVRAGIMISCLMLSRLLFRQPHLFPALVFSAWLVLIRSPDQLFNLGFQLSYSVVASIILIGLPASSVITAGLRHGLKSVGPVNFHKRLLLKAAHGFIEISCISFSAGLVSIPLIIEHFRLFTPGGLIIGIILNPIATLVIAVGCLSLCLIPASAILASHITRIAYPVIVTMEWILQACVQIPGAYSSREWVLPHAGTIVVIIALGSAWILQYMKQQSRMMQGSYLAIPFLLVIGSLIFGTLST